jgi:ferrochelatase
MAGMTSTTKSGFTHGTRPRSAVLVINLGTPDEPTPKAVRRYLAEFLSDRRVVEIPKLLWSLILYGIILPIRSKKSAAKYASIWTTDGSPLKVWTEKQAKMLQGYLFDRGWDVEVAWAMRYGNPSIASVIQALAEKGVERILVLPMYPQYSAATTATAYDAVMKQMSKMRNVPELRFIKHYHDHPAYIAALVARWRNHLEQNGQPDQLLLSFHGMPRRTLDLGDPYHCECHKTARLFAEAAGIEPGHMQVTFQSRFGKAAWLQPYTAPTAHAFGKSGLGKLAVMCPGFTADCLETLEEIAQEVRDDFLVAGGKTFDYVSCLNDRPEFIDALATLCEEHGKGWLDRMETRNLRDMEAKGSAARAQAMMMR